MNFNQAQKQYIAKLIKKASMNKTSNFLKHCKKDLEKRLLEIPKYKNEISLAQMNWDIKTTKEWIKCVEWQIKLLKDLK